MKGVFVFVYLLHCVLGGAQIDANKYNRPGSRYSNQLKIKAFDSVTIIRSGPPVLPITVHGGTILLAPFLKSLYQTLNLMQGNEWINADAKIRAATLLHYVSNGEQNINDQCLVEKLLCGIPIETNIATKISLTETEISHAESLLKSVIQQWKGLNNTSNNGFRETFLKRQGILNTALTDGLYKWKKIAQTYY
jgi:hypothetical protein